MPDDQVARARVLLAKEGLPSAEISGYEILDKGDGLTANQFQQQMNRAPRWKASWDERSVGIHGVRRAGVRLVCRAGSRSRASGRMPRRA